MARTECSHRGAAESWLENQISGKAHDNVTRLARLLQAIEHSVCFLMRRLWQKPETYWCSASHALNSNDEGFVSTLDLFENVGSLGRPNEGFRRLIMSVDVIVNGLDPL